MNFTCFSLWEFLLFRSCMFFKFSWVNKPLHISKCRNSLHFYQVQKLSLPFKAYQGDIFTDCRSIYHSKGATFSLCRSVFNYRGATYLVLVSLSLTAGEWHFSHWESSDLSLCLVWMSLESSGSWLVVDAFWSFIS